MVMIATLVFGAFSPSVIAASSTALKWTPQTAAVATSWNSVVWSPELNLFVAVAVGATNNVMTSPDGKTWTAHSTPVAVNLRDVVWAASIGKFIAIAPTGQTFSSTDGSTPAVVGNTYLVARVRNASGG